MNAETRNHYLGDHSKDFSEACDEIYSDTYSKSYKIKDNINDREVVIKIYVKNLIDSSNQRDYILSQIQFEIKLLSSLIHDNIIKLYDHFETEDSIVLILENYDADLRYYLYNEGPLNEERKLFTDVVQSVVNALKYLNSQSIIHRDIKPSNFYIQFTDNKKEYRIKIGNFFNATYIKDNDNKIVGTLNYMAPEILNGDCYNEKCDLWSLGISFYHLYNGFSPYGLNLNENKIKEIFYQRDNFIFSSTKNKNLDILVKMLLYIDPAKRVSFEELSKFVYGNFMDENYDFSKEEKYQKIYEDMKNKVCNAIFVELDEIKECFLIKKEDENEVENIINIVKGKNLKGMISFINETKIMINNILYYDENLDNSDAVEFEKNINGAFILCKKIESFILMMEEIINCFKNDNRVKFNLIISGNYGKKILKYLTEKSYLICIEQIYIYNNNNGNYLTLKKQFPIITDILNEKMKICEIINKNASNNIKQFKFNKSITYDDLAKYYGEYKRNEFFRILKNEKNYKLLRIFKIFDSTSKNPDLEILNKLIINEYSEYTLYDELSIKLKLSHELNMYFVARLIYTTYSLATKYNKFFNEKKVLMKGEKVKYSNILPYLRNKGKIIFIFDYINASENEEIEIKNAERDKIKNLENKEKFSVVFYINNVAENQSINSSINFKAGNLKEILFLPFSLYFVKKVEINIKERKADIYLETISGKYIFENEIKKK